MPNPPDYKGAPSKTPQNNVNKKKKDENPDCPAHSQNINNKKDKKKTYGKGASMPVLASDLWADVEVPELQEFNPEDIKLDGTVVAVGKRRTGKTWCFRNIMYLMKDKIPAGIVISQTDELNKFWRDYVPKKYIFKKYQPEILDAVFARQKKILNDKAMTDEEKDKEKIRKLTIEIKQIKKRLIALEKGGSVAIDAEPEPELEDPCEQHNFNECNVEPQINECIWDHEKGKCVSR